MFSFIARGIGFILLSLVLLAVALAFWPLALIGIIVVVAFRLGEFGRYGQKNEFGYRPLKKRDIWQAKGYWFTTDGHPQYPDVIGPFPTRRHAQRFVDGEHFMADDEGLFSISMR